MSQHEIGTFVVSRSLEEIENLLQERGKTHGDWVEQAQICQNLKQIVANTPGDLLPAYQLEALHMICHKISRIVAGNPNHKDHWDDIAGYAKLVSNRL